MIQQKTAVSIEDRLRLVLTVLEKNQVESMMDLLSDLPVELIRDPEPGLIMIQSQDCFEVDFYLGELLVTTAEVEVFGIKAHATVMGKEPLKAVLAATVNAVQRSSQASELDRLAPLIDEYLQAYDNLREQERRLTAATKVNFESMAKEA